MSPSIEMPFLSCTSYSQSIGYEMVKIHALSLGSPGSKEIMTSLSLREAVPVNPKVLGDLELLKT